MGQRAEHQAKKEIARKIALEEGAWSNAKSTNSTLIRWMTTLWTGRASGHAE